MDLEQNIREKAAEGWGRTRIMRAHPEASEWLIRNIIAEVRGGHAHTIAPVADRPLPNRSVAETLRPIQVKLAAPRPTTKANPDYQHTVAIFGDVHAPFHHEKNTRVAAEVIRHQAGIRLDEVICLGDHWDFYTVSSYDKNPMRRNQLQDELVVGAQVLGQFTEAAGDTPKVFLPGNHEARLENYIARNAPALAAMPALQLPSVLGLESMGWEYKPDYHLIKDTFLVHHGAIVAGEAGATAKKEMYDAGISGASGHVHRLAVVPRITWIQAIRQEAPSIWIETGCLCQRDQEYRLGRHSNWHPGMVLVQILEDGSIIPELIHIHEGRAAVGGRLLSVD